MIYDFAAKIRDVQNDEMLIPEKGVEAVNEYMRTKRSPMEITLRHDKDLNRDLMVKGKISVTSYMPLQERELEDAINLFKEHLEDIAVILDGKISQNEAFYNNSKSFARLYY